MFLEQVESTKWQIVEKISYGQFLFDEIREKGDSEN